jgi:hypothetical protein
MRRLLWLALVPAFFCTPSWGQGGIVGNNGILGKNGVVGGAAASSGGAAPSVLKTGGTGVTVATCNSSTTTCALTYTPHASGDWAVLGVPYSTAHVPTGVSDNGSSGGSTWVQVTGSSSTFNTSNAMRLYCTTSLAAGVTTITVAGGGVGALIIEGSGGTAPCTVDQSVTTTHQTLVTSWSSTATSNTTNANDISIGMAFDTSTENSGWVGTNSYTALTGNYDADDGWGFTMAYLVVSSTGAQTATGTVTNADVVNTAIWVLE